MQNVAAECLHVAHVEGGVRARASVGQRADVRHLPALLGVEGRGVQHDANLRARLGGLDKAQPLPGVDRGHRAGQRRPSARGRVPRVLGLVVRRPHAQLAQLVELVGLERERAAGAKRRGAAALSSGLLEQRLEAGHVDGQPLLGGHQLGQVGREAERREEQVHVVRGQHGARAAGRHAAVGAAGTAGGAAGQARRAFGELFESVGERAGELRLLLAQHVGDRVGPQQQLGEGVALRGVDVGGVGEFILALSVRVCALAEGGAVVSGAARGCARFGRRGGRGGGAAPARRAHHELHDGGHELVEESRRRLQNVGAVADRAPQDAPQHVAAPLVRRERSVGDREGERADVVGDHAVGHVDQVGVLGAHLHGGRGGVRSRVSARGWAAEVRPGRAEAAAAAAPPDLSFRASWAC